MAENNGATPAINAATPPTNVPPVNNVPPIVTPPANNQDGKVTITTKEFAQLSRDAARGRSAQRRTEIQGRAPVTDPNLPPDAAQAIQEANDRAAIAEKSALRIEVQAKTREILEKDEFKSLPRSTKELILKNPSLLSEASTLDEALLDIEDYVRDQVLILETNSQAAVVVPSTVQPAGHDAPPIVNNGGAADVKADGLEDVSKLSGPARSQAMIRNTMRKAQGVKKS